MKRLNTLNPKRKPPRFVLQCVTLGLLVAVLAVLALPACSADDPLPDDVYTKNIYPSENNTYRIGSGELVHSEGYFNILSLLESLNIFGDTYSENITPRNSDNYSIGANATPFDEGYFRHLYIDGEEVSVNASGGGNITDHGELTGLLDDDHTQYHTDNRGDARYYTEMELDVGQLDNRYYTENELDAGQLDTRYYTEGETDAAIDTDISTHSDLSTSTHGVGTGTISSVSTANKNIYVDKEATGAADGTSWADAFTTWDACKDTAFPDIIGLGHTYTVWVRDGTKKTGTCDSDEANKIADTGEFPDSITWAGRRVFNVDDGTWGVVGARDDDDTLSIVDIAGAALDLCPDGDEDYVIEPTPYRETWDIDGITVVGSLLIKAEHYWYGTCEANVNAGEIKDTGATWTGIEVGDRVMVIDRNGANDRCQTYEYGTVDDVSQIGSSIIRTTLTGTPTTKWSYVITKAENSASDDGLESGTARDYCFKLVSINKVKLYGFYVTFSDVYGIGFGDARACEFHGFIFEYCDFGVNVQTLSEVTSDYVLFETIASYAIVVDKKSSYQLYYFAAEGGGTAAFLAYRMCYADIRYGYIHTSSQGFRLKEMAICYIQRCTIAASVTTGIYARHNSVAEVVLTTNSATTPEDPVGTSDNPYIGG